MSALSPVPDEARTARRARRALAAVEARPPDFELLFRSAPSLLIVLEPEPRLRVVAASDAYLRAARVSRESALGRPFFEAFPECRDGPRSTGAGSMRDALARVLATGCPDALNTPVFGADGEMLYIIHRIDALELEVLRAAHERDEALRRAQALDEEGEALGHAVATQLRAPLRAIDAFCGLFTQMHGPFLDGEVRRLLRRIGDKVNRMETIIDGLLGLSRAGRMPMARRHIDVTALARRVVARLAAREPSREVTVEIAEGLEAWADEGLACVVLENVIANAWKYTRRRPHARIEVGARRSAGQTVFHVRDNGVGFDMAQAGRLFAPFVRLHDDIEFEGYGIGLTSAKRIVERHGGEIWAEARPGEGATIHFTLGAGPG
ncbi:MAG TPA: ATP-binding protein [Usitatibacter sp.]|nr:ATP-binding protein [Usitatibacter sp.]